MGDKPKVGPDGEINYVASMHFWADAYKRELRSQREWPGKYRFLVDCYRDVNNKMDKGKPLPSKSLRAKTDDFKPFEPKPEKLQPLPYTMTSRYGWNVGPGTNRIELLDSLTKPRPRVSIFKQLGWREGSQE